MALSIVELDAKRHNRTGLDYGDEALNRHLKSLTAQHRAKGMSTTFVPIASNNPHDILGFYSLRATKLAFGELEDAYRKALASHPTPAVRIGRLDMATASRPRRFGELLLQDVVRRTIAARRSIGVYAVVVEARDSAAETFHRKYGFRLGDALTWQLISAARPRSTCGDDDSSWHQRSITEIGQTMKVNKFERKFDAAKEMVD